MTELTKSIPTKIDRTDLPRLKAYATAHNIDCVKAITRLLDLSAAFPNLDTLPRPEGGAIVPVETRENIVHLMSDVNPDQDSHDYREG
jgi:hypothetical protein